MLNGGINPIAPKLVNLGETLKAMRPGQVFQTLVQGNQDETWLLLGGQRVPLDKSVGLLPGQPIRAEVAENSPGLQLRITLLTADTPTPASSELGGLISRVLASLEAMPAAAYAARMLPEGLPRSEKSVRQVLSLFVGQTALGEELESLLSLISDAVRAGTLPEDLIQRFQGLMPGKEGIDPKSLMSLLHMASKDSGLESHLAKFLDSANPEHLLKSLVDEWRGILADIKRHEPFLVWLKNQGKTRAFEQAMDRVGNRLAGARLQNLHGLDQSYYFLEVPLPRDSGIQRAIFHLMNEGSGHGKRGVDPHNVSIAMDLSTTQLGDLWVTIRTAQSMCHCQFRATEANTIHMIEEHREELQAALADAGFPGAQVAAGLWDGDRVRETAQLLQRFTRINWSV